MNLRKVPQVRAVIEKKCALTRASPIAIKVSQAIIECIAARLKFAASVSSKQDGIDLVTSTNGTEQFSFNEHRWRNLHTHLVPLLNGNNRSHD